MVKINKKILNKYCLILLLVIINSKANGQGVFDSLYKEIIKVEDYLKISEKKPENTVYIFIGNDQEDTFRLPLIYNFTNTKFLTVWRVEQYTFTKELNRLTNLESISFAFVKDIRFSKDIKAFPKLMLFYLRDNVTTPDFIYMCLNLCDLAINVEDTEKFSKSIKNLNRLEFLWVYFKKKIKHIPDSIYDLKNLETLFIYHNSRKRLPLSKNILKLKNLDSLCLPIELNKKNIEILSQMKQLKHLVMTTNKISDYEELKKISFLKTLYLKKIIRQKKLYKIKMFLPNTKIICQKYKEWGRLSQFAIF